MASAPSFSKTIQAATSLWALETCPEAPSKSLVESESSRAGRVEVLQIDVSNTESVVQAAAHVRQKLIKLESAKLRNDSVRQKLIKLESAKLRNDSVRQKLIKLESAKLRNDSVRQKLIKLESAKLRNDSAS
eukprot:gene29515-5864_t